MSTRRGVFGVPRWLQWPLEALRARVYWWAWRRSYAWREPGAPHHPLRWRLVEVVRCVTVRPRLDGKEWRFFLYDLLPEPFDWYERRWERRHPEFRPGAGPYIGEWYWRLKEWPGRDDYSDLA